MPPLLRVFVLFALAAVATATRYPLVINDTITAAVAVNDSLLVLISAASGRIYAANASSQTWLSTNWQLNSTTNNYVTAQLAHSRYIIVVGAEINAFDTWDRMRPGITGQFSAPLYAYATLLLDASTGSLLMAGGRTLNNTIVNWVTRIAVENDSAVATSPAMPLPQTRYAHEAVQAPGFLAVIGGLTQVLAQTPQLTDTIDASTNNGDSWFTMADPLSRARAASCATIALGRYLVVAGGIFYSPYNTTNEVDVFDLITLRRIHVTALRERRAWCAAAALGPYVYIAGGSDTNLLASRTLSSVEVFDVRDFTLFYVANLSIARQEMAVAETPDAVYFISGAASPTIDYYQCGNGRIDAGEICDVNDAGCFKNCTDRRVNATVSTPPPATKTASRINHCIVALPLLVRLIYTP